jgi:hypothetical protein
VGASSEAGSSDVGSGVTFGPQATASMPAPASTIPDFKNNLRDILYSLSFLTVICSLLAQNMK